MCISKFFYPPLFLSLLTVSCKEAPKQPQLDENLLIGRWEITQAWRNGRPTETLTGTFYEFMENGAMRTNLTASGVEEESPFEVNGFEIVQESSPEKVKYSVTELSDSVLTLDMHIKNFPFRIRLAKYNPLPALEADTIQ